MASCTSWEWGMVSGGRTHYVCRQCSSATLQWVGQCPGCGEWNSLAEVSGGDSPPVAGARKPVVSLDTVPVEDALRVASGLHEMDRVLGGGIVRGAVILIGGDPGIGKSTLLLQVLAHLAGQLKTLYVSGEESLGQVAMRARRLGLARVDLPAIAETNLEAILAVMNEVHPALVVIDSVQTLNTTSLGSAPGSVSQLRECAARLVRYAKSAGCAVVLVGHVTKDGAIAGPRVLEHMVDTVLYLEHETNSRFRIVRSVKNRFGAVNEIGVFAMTDDGLREVANPSALFLSGHRAAVSGSVITVTRQGTRPFLVEVQALVDDNHGTAPRLLTLGLDSGRLAMLLAVLHRHAGIALGGQDVFANVVGGMRIQETAADLPLLLATLSSFRGRPVPADLVVFGEVGLAGEIRPVIGGEERLLEAAKHGFTKAVVPTANKPRRGTKTGLDVAVVARLDQAIACI